MNPIHKKRLQRKHSRWINTAFARNYKFRRAVRFSGMVSAMCATTARISAIRSAKAFAPADKANKAMAIANEIIGVHQSIRAEMLQLNPPPHRKI